MGVIRPLDPQTVEYSDSVFDYPSSGTSSTMDEDFDEVFFVNLDFLANLVLKLAPFDHQAWHVFDLNF